MNPSFVHLRIHSEFSLVDGIVKIKPLVKKLVDYQMPAAAITEQSNLFSLVKFYKAAQGAGIKPLIGADVWIYNPEEPASPFRMTLLARNKSGYVTLTELISQGYQLGQHQGIPMLQKDWIESNHQGLIALSGAMSGDIGQALLAENNELAEQYAQYWQNLFPDSFYLELQRVGKNNEERYIKLAVDLAGQFDLPVVATNDVRFINQADFEAHEVRVCIQPNAVMSN
jgi:DNA polymerase-3 subunit alpha